MSKKKLKDKIAGRVGTLLSKILLAVAVLFFIICCGIVAASREDAGNVEYSTTSLQYDIKEGRYYNLPRKTANNRMNGVGIGETQYEECYAVADYFYASVLYSKYALSGDSALAENYLALKTSAKEKMGLYKPEAAVIDEKIEAFINKK